MHDYVNQSLIDRLYKVFPRLPPIETSEVSNYSDDRGGGLLRRDFGGIPWWEISKDVLEKNVDMLPIFSSKGFWYYYPAYLSHGLERFSYENTVLEFSIYALSASDESWYKVRFRHFSDEQIDFLRDLLLFIVEEDSLDLTSEAREGLRCLSSL